MSKDTTISNNDGTTRVTENDSNPISSVNTGSSRKITIPKKRVLSIQSHVVSGYVGNKAAVFPLQLLGFEVDIVNSVQFSNHTGYEHGFKGDILSGQQLLDLLFGLQSNDLLKDIGYILTGYIGSESFLQAVLTVVTTIRQYNPTVQYICDPVLGDHGKLYVPSSLVEVYKQNVLPVANVITPNQFEVEQLTGIVTQTLDDAIRACSVLHTMGPSLVFITSLVLQDAPADTLSILASLKKQRQNDDGTTTKSTSKIWQIHCPVLPGRYTGTGDVTAALLLAHTALVREKLVLSSSNDGTAPNEEEVENQIIPTAMEQVINTMFTLLERTQEVTSSNPSSTAQSRELKLIQSKSIIEHPPQRFHCIRIR